MIRKLAVACDTAHLRYEGELYAGRHGFAVSDNPAFHVPSADKHWLKMLALFKETLH
jgi:dienelactone hydrolase